MSVIVIGGGKAMEIIAHMESLRRIGALKPEHDEEYQEIKRKLAALHEKVAQK